METRPNQLDAWLKDSQEFPLQIPPQVDEDWGQPLEDELLFFREGEEDKPITLKFTLGEARWGGGGERPCPMTMCS